MSSKNNTKMDSFNKGNCVFFFQCKSTKTLFHLAYAAHKEEFQRPLSTSQNHLSSLSTKWLQYGTKILYLKHYRSRHTSIQTFTHTLRRVTSIIGIYTVPWTAGIWEYQPRGNDCSIIRTCSCLIKKKINRTNASEDFTVKCSKSYTLLKISNSLICMLSLLCFP